MMPKVSICMITYNHEKFIEQAIDSVLMQKADFDYELVIGEDCSHDRTREIVKDYQRRYPGKIRLILPEKNLGMIPNFVQTLRSCQGRYVALLEGDDYWTDPLKLQKQADFLDKNPEFVTCFHNAAYLWQIDKRGPDFLCVEGLKEVSTLEDIIYENFIPTLTVMFRNKLFDNFPEWFFKSKYGDWPLHILNAQYGKIYYMNESMAVYRISPATATSAAHYDMDIYIRNIEELICICKKVNAFFGYRYNSIIARGLAEYYLSLAKTYYKKDRKYICLKCLVVSKIFRLVYLLKI